MDTATQARVHQLIASKVMPLAKDGFGQIKVSLPKLADAVRKVDASIKQNEDPEALATYRRALAIAMRAVVDARLVLRQATDALSEATQDDDDFAADEAEIEKLKSQLVASINVSKDQLAKAKACDDRAVKQVARSGADEKRAVREWASLVTVADRNVDELQKRLKLLEAWSRQAASAVASHDGAGLKQLQAATPRFAIPDAALKGDFLIDMFQDYVDSFAIDSFSAAFQEAFKSDSKKLGAQNKTLTDLARRAKQMMDDGDRLVVKARDAKKAATVLGLPSGALARLEDALDCSDDALVKSLDALARQLKLDSTGKAMFEKLKKAGIV